MRSCRRKPVKKNRIVAEQHWALAGDDKGYMTSLNDDSRGRSIGCPRPDQTNHAASAISPPGFVRTSLRSFHNRHPSQFGLASVGAVFHPGRSRICATALLTRAGRSLKIELSNRRAERKSSLLPCLRFPGPIHRILLDTPCRAIFELTYSK